MKIRAMAVALLAVSPALAQSIDPFPSPIPAAEGVVRVSFVEFASIPDMNGEAARMMRLVDEPGTRRLFVNDMRGPIYSVSYDGKSVALYIDINAPQWKVGVQSMGRERGMQSFAFHPQFAQAGAPGFGKFYTWTDVVDTSPTPDFGPDASTSTRRFSSNGRRRIPRAAFDGGPPREMMRLQQPFANHNGGLLSFNPLVIGDPDFGLLYVGVADGGSGGDPFNLRKTSAVFGRDSADRSAWQKQREQEVRDSSEQSVRRR